MKCSICGAELKDGAQFCGSCGNKVVVESVVTEPAPAAANQAYSTAASTAPTYNTTASNGYGAPAQQTYRQEGCLGAGWRDITSSPGWFKRLLLLAIMNCVPVLNFFVTGYCVKWGADVAGGKRETLPRGNFCKHTFVVGLLAYVLNVLLTIANLWLYAINAIPFIGFIISFVINLFASAFLSLAIMRMAVRRRFGAAFDLSEIMRRYKTRVGSLLASAVVPGIITTAIFVIIALLVLFICAGIAVATFNTGSAASYSNLMYLLNGFAYNPVGSAIAIASTLGILIVILVALFLFLNAFANVWSMRAVGHWVAQNAPQWSDDAVEAEIESM